MTGTFLGAPALERLNAACLLVREAFGDYGVYLVGSCLLRADYRDVDVRVILRDERYAQLFGDPHHGSCNPLRALVDLTTSEYLTRITGLPIDFQVQQQTDANRRYPEQRHPLGFYVRDRGDAQ